MSRPGPLGQASPTGCARPEGRSRVIGADTDRGAQPEGGAPGVPPEGGLPGGVPSEGGLPTIGRWSSHPGVLPQVNPQVRPRFPIVPAAGEPVAVGIFLRGLGRPRNPFPEMRRQHFGTLRRVAHDTPLHCDECGD